MGVVGQHGEPEMPCWARSQCHRQRGSHPFYLKDVVLGAYPSPQLGYKRTLLWGLPLHCWMDLESHLPRSQSLRVRSKLAGQCPPTRCST